MAAPVGNQNAAKAKIWHGAILRALDKRGAGDRLAALDELATKLLEACATGDLPALKEFGDRLDGKPSQSVEMSGELGIRKAVDLSDDQLAEIAHAGRPKSQA